jgi:peptide deformylase
MFGSLKIRLLGDPVLRQKAKPVKEVGPVERMLITAMFETMESHKGIGLAAPQVGVSEQIFIIDTGKEAFAVINPKILKSTGQDILEEGCLSIPNVHVNVKRAKVIDVEFMDEHNHIVWAKLSGMTAKVFQHESDHLAGKLIIDYLSPQEQSSILKQIKDGVPTGKVERANA